METLGSCLQDMELKLGDVVVCTYDAYTASSHWTVGREYTVQQDGTLYTDLGSKCRSTSARFVLASSENNLGKETMEAQPVSLKLSDLLLVEGDKYRCIRANSSNFTVGDVYIAELSWNSKHLGFIGDAGNFISVGASEFVPAESPEVASMEHDVVNRPSHYTRWEIEPVEFLLRNRVEGHTFNIVKYAMRAGHKLYEGKTSEESEVIDLEKVRRYAEMRINLLKGKETL